MIEIIDSLVELLKIHGDANEADMQYIVGVSLIFGYLVLRIHNTNQVHRKGKVTHNVKEHNLHGLH